MKTVFVVAFLALVCAVVAIPLTQAEAMDQFEIFKSKYNKEYATWHEHNYRFKNFLDNIQQIEKMNGGQNSAQFGINQFADMSTEEFRQHYTGAVGAGPIYVQSCLASHAYKELPPIEAAASCDWTNTQLISPVKNQQECGSCWAFGTAASMEAAYAIRVSGSAISLSEEQIVECSTACSYEIFQGQNVSVCNGGCGGGWPWGAMGDIAAWGGLMTESAYPYQSGANSCPSSWPAALNAALDTKKPFHCLSTPNGAPADEKMMAAFVASQGPVAIALDASPLSFYTGGVLVPDNQTVSCAEYALDHVVTVVGFDDTANPPYWKVRNSWGNTWGEAGYFRIAKGVNACGMTMAVISPNLKGSPAPKATCPAASTKNF